LFITTHMNLQVAILYRGIFKIYHLSKLPKWYPDMVLQARVLSMNSSICTQIYLIQYTVARRVSSLQTHNPLTKKDHDYITHFFHFIIHNRITYFI
jgi:hypothetical protein